MNLEAQRTLHTFIGYTEYTYILLGLVVLKACSLGRCHSLYCQTIIQDKLRRFRDLKAFHNSLYLFIDLINTVSGLLAAKAAMVQEKNTITNTWVKKFSKT